jgi:twitching motility protein PilT
METLMAKLDDLFRVMVKNEASDLHLTSGSIPSLRVHGDITPLKYRALNDNEVRALIYEILTDDQIKRFEENLELDCSYAVEGCGRFRCNIFMQRLGIGSVFRHIPSKVLSMKDLNSPDVFKTILQEKKGMILVTGPTGSGKSTTLAAMIDYINETDAGHILTIEDPIEFVHQNKKSIVNQREVGNHTKSFKYALKAALREDPDIILVGEMRDLETISLAMTAAETGHLVFGTLHTMSAPKTVDRIIDSFPEEQQSQIRVMLSESLKAVISQTLLKKEGGGRVAAHEIMINNTAIQNLIREGKTFQIKSTMQTATGIGMQTMESAVEKLVSLGTINKKEALPYLAKKTFATDDEADGHTQTQAKKPFTMPSFKKSG